MNEQLRAWLRAAETLRHLDAAIAAAATIAFQHQRHPPYELAQSLNDLLNLVGGNDCCYDRPSIGPTYAMWYQGQRTHDVLRLIGSAVAGVRGELSILDLGAGTGSTLFAVALVLAGQMHTQQQHASRVHIRSVDSSPFMLEHARLGWQELVHRFPALRDVVHPEFVCTTWPKASPFNGGDCVAIASYMFDHSDERRTAEIANAFKGVLARTRATELFLLAGQQRRVVTDAVIDSLRESGWTHDELHLEDLWNGTLQTTHRYRAELYSGARLQNGQLWRNAPPWNDNRQKSAYRLAATARPEPIAQVRFAGSIEPDTVQHEVAAPTDRPTLVFGAAGSGKSIVLAERVARVLESWQQRQAERLIATDHPPRVLVTGFNKDMVRRLKELTAERLGDGWNENRIAHGHFVLRPQNLDDPHAVFANWDLLSTRILGFPANGGRNWESKIEELLGEETAQLLPEYARNEDWLLSELRRIVWGQRAYRRTVYCGGTGVRPVDRVGRLIPLPAEMRQTVWRIVMEGGALHHVHRLIDSHSRMQSSINAKTPWRGNGFRPFSHVFVDECQDFTRADFDIVAAVSDEGTRVFATGDHAQALRLGRSCPVPGLIRTRRWERRELLGSYRLPLRVCEAVCPLAEFIAQADGTGVQDNERLAALPQAMKAATLGVRPVLVVGVSRDALASALSSVLWTYSAILAQAHDPAHNLISIVEEDEELRALLVPRMNGAPQNVPIVSESMHSIKGLERSCVVWSTAAAFDTDESHEEWAYTILTRATCLLIVAMMPNETPESIRRIIGRLRPDRVLFWSSEAEEEFGRCVMLAG